MLVASYLVTKGYEQAGLPDMRFHGLRHTCATLQLSRGHHPKLVQELLGHASVAMTLDRYSHVLPGMGTRLPPRWRLPCPEIARGRVGKERPWRLDGSGLPEGFEHDQ
jgi:integrase